MHRTSRPHGLWKERFYGAPLWLPWSGWLLMFFALPLGFLVLVSFWSMENQTLIPGFTLDNYRAVFSAASGNTALMLKTCSTALVVVVIAAAMCYPVAYLLTTRMTSRTAVVTSLLLVALPFLVGPLIRTIAWQGVLGVQGVLNALLTGLGIVDSPIRWLLFSRFATTVALVYNIYPFMLFVLVLSLETLDRQLLGAARDLGAGALRGFCHVVLPLSAPGLIVGLVLTFVPAASASLEPEILGGPGGRFTANAISDRFFLALDWPAGAALTVSFSIVVAVVTGLLIGLVYGLFRRVFVLGRQT